MKVLLKKLLLVAVFSLPLFFYNCSDDEGIDVPIRDTDNISFLYSENTQKFSVRTDGHWTVAADVPWLSFSQESGDGNGENIEWVSVTAERNKSDKRTGVISIKRGDKTSEIAVTQEDGHFAIGSLSLDGDPLEYEVEIGATYLVIPYVKATSADKATTKTQITGIPGMKIQDVSDYTLADGNGSIKLAISGIPEAEGTAEFAVEVIVNGESMAKLKFKKSIGYILRQGFKKFIWGGDYINQLPGEKSNRKNSATPADEFEEAYIESCTDKTDGTNNMFGKALRAAFVDDASDPRELLGWDGWGGFERPGYIKMGTGSYGGWLASKPLTGINKEETVTLYVSFKFCRWYEEPDAVIPFKIEGKGKPEITTLSSDQDYTWKEYRIKVTEAQHGDIIVWGDNSGGHADNKATGKTRYFLDDIEVSIE